MIQEYKIVEKFLDQKVIRQWSVGDGWYTLWQETVQYTDGTIEQRTTTTKTIVHYTENGMAMMENYTIR